jgi:dsDNA-specific endonuclease/ATPase MutS2
MDRAILKKMQSIIFIHGIGDGVLKNRILNALRDYKGVKSKPAPIGKYGLGALEVIF